MKTMALGLMMAGGMMAAAVTAEAGGPHWSFGINLGSGGFGIAVGVAPPRPVVHVPACPPPVVVVPAHRSRPVIVTAPVVVVPHRVIVAPRCPPPRVIRVPARVCAPPPVIYAPAHGHRSHGWHGPHRHGRH